MYKKICNFLKGNADSSSSRTLLLTSKKEENDVDDNSPISMSIRNENALMNDSIYLLLKSFILTFCE